MSKSISAIEEAIHRQEAEEKADRAIAKAKTRLIMGRVVKGQREPDARSVFFSILAMKLRMEVDWRVRTACVNGRVMKYNPSFFAGLDEHEALGVLLHEVMHCALGHFSRRGAREPRRWNIATDLAINEILLASGFTLPAGCLHPGKPPHEKMPLGLSSEEYYRLLQDKGGKGGSDKGQGGQGDDEGEEGDGGDDPGGCGGVEDGDTETEAEDAADWQVSVAQAADAAARKGNLPAGLDRFASEIIHPAADWRQLLRRFIDSFARNDFSWLPPSKRHVWQNIYLPSLRSEELGTVVVAVDTSGSISAEDIGMFQSEIAAILGAFSCTVKVFYHDVEVAGDQEWRSEDGPLELKPKGGGGTSHIPVFRKIAELEQPPKCVVCMTDGYTCWPPKPDVPVLWAMTSPVEPPWGETIRIA